MRLFIAVGLSEQVKDVLCREIQWLRQNAVQGSFTRRENLHLTLAFLGETSQVEKAKQAMEQAVCPAFAISLGRSGRFVRREGDIFWRGLMPNPQLESLWKELSHQLRQRHFALEERKFLPHLTLGRRVILAPGQEPEEQNFGTGEMEVSKISLMKSERVMGRLVYTELFVQPLK